MRECFAALKTKKESESQIANRSQDLRILIIPF